MAGRSSFFYAQVGNSIFATTALVATAGIASADIALTGSAQMGIEDDGTAAGTQFVQDIDITFTMSGSTDNGLTFGAAIDLDENAGAVDNDDAGVAIFVSGNFGTLTMGDTDGALDWAMQEVDFNGAASISDDHTIHAGFNGNAGLDGHYDGQILRYDYTFGAFGVALSVEQDDNNTNLGNSTTGIGAFGIPHGAPPNNTAVRADPIFALGLRYAGEFAGGSYGVGLGYQATNDGLEAAGDQGVSVTGVSANVALDSGLSAAVNYSIIEIDGANNDGVHMGIGVSYTFDAITVHANYGQYEWDAGALSADAEGFGLSAAYDLGGGLSAHLGYGSSDVVGVPDVDTWSLGLNMSF